MPLRGLLKTSNEFVWDSMHTAALESVKEEILSLHTLSSFVPGAELRLETDAFLLKGLGFVLWQRHGDAWHILQCGSRYLSDAETRYAVIELEMLGVVWAVRKCHLFLAGAPFAVVTDHRPLVPILNSYSLDQIENPRLQRLVMKLRSYQLHASWRKGTENAFADALSRNPVNSPVPADEFGEDPALSSLGIHACIQSTSSIDGIDLRYKVLTAARAHPDYQALINVIHHGFPPTLHKLCPATRPYWTFREHLSVADGLVLKGQRVVIPQALRQNVLNFLHTAHQRLTRTKSRARQIVFSLSHDFNQLVRSCPQCRLYAPVSAQITFVGHR